MKKVLIASTALAVTGLLSNGPAFAAEKIKLDLGGYSKWWVVGAWQDSSFEQGTGVGYTNVDVKGDNEVFFGGETTLDNGMKVGINIELEAGGGTETTNNSTDVIDKSYVFVESKFGKVIIGTEANGTVLLHVMAPDAAGVWGTDSLLNSGNSVVKPTNVNVMATTEIDTDGDAEKITYVTPSFYGLTLGASYIPHAGRQDTMSLPQSMSVYGVGAGYANTFGPIGVKLSSGFVWGDANSAGVTGDLQEISAGTQLAWGPVTVGGSYRQRILDDKGGQSAASTAPFTNIDGHVWDAGIQYDAGIWQVSFAYMNSKNSDAVTAGDDEMTTYQVSGKYSLSAGVDLVASAGHVEFNDETQQASSGGDSNHNEGWMVATGLSLTF